MKQKHIWFDKIHFRAVFDDNNRCQYKTVTHIFHVLLHNTQYIYYYYYFIIYYDTSFVLLLVRSFVRILRVYTYAYYELIDITNGWQISVNNAILLLHNFLFVNFTELALYIFLYVCVCIHIYLILCFDEQLWQREKSCWASRSPHLSLPFCSTDSFGFV